jgi:peptidoglycan/LPS O-acetylase OafA/YrhL
MPADQHPMRFGFLDGLRGWAAVIVLFHHVFVDGLPANDFMADRLFWARIFFMNGTFAVCLFFVISGFRCRSATCRQAMKEDWRAWRRAVT